MAKQGYTLLPTRKFRMLRVKQILEQETDAAHSITMTRLLELLNEDIESDRRTLYEDVQDLKCLGTEVSIDKHQIPPRLKVTKRIFTLSELKLMIDAIASSKFLTKTASQELIDKLKMFCSRYEADELNRQTLLANRTKRIDTDFHNNVSTISLAIDAGKQINFKYFRINVRGKREYNKYDSTVSPWVMVYADDNYYLMAFDGKKMRHYRVDRMDEIKITDDVRQGEDVYKKVKEELPFRTQSTFNLFGGEKEMVTLRCSNYFYYVIADKFGGDIHPMIDRATDTFTVTVPVAVGDQFFGWVFGMKNRVVIEGPESVKQKMKKILEDVGKWY